MEIINISEPIFKEIDHEQNGNQRTILECFDKNCPTIYPKFEQLKIDGYISEKNFDALKKKQESQGFLSILDNDIILVNSESMINCKKVSFTFMVSSNKLILHEQVNGMNVKSFKIFEKCEFICKSDNEFQIIGNKFLEDKQNKIKERINMYDVNFNNDIPNKFEEAEKFTDDILSKFFPFLKQTFQLFKEIYIKLEDNKKFQEILYYKFLKKLIILFSLKNFSWERLSNFYAISKENIKEIVIPDKFNKNKNICEMEKLIFKKLGQAFEINQDVQKLKCDESLKVRYQDLPYYQYLYKSLLTKLIVKKLENTSDIKERKNLMVKEKTILNEILPKAQLIEFLKLKAQNK
jgi:hypothetical protein